MQMIDVLNKLREIQSRSPEELGRAIDSVSKMNSPQKAEVTFEETAPKVESKISETKSANEKSYMVDVLAKLSEIADRSPEIANAIDSAKRMNGSVAEGVEIKTTGEDAILAQILKLAGMVGGENNPELAAGPLDKPVDEPMSEPMGDIPHDHAMVPSSPVMDKSDDDDDVIAGPVTTLTPDMLDDDVDNPKDRPYTNSPHEQVSGFSAAVPAGNDLAKPKLTGPKVAGGDNPIHVAVSFD